MMVQVLNSPTLDSFNLGFDKELVLKNEFDNDLIGFIDGRPPQIYDITLKLILEENKGVFLAPFQAKKIANKSFVSLSEKEFFQAFTLAFKDVCTANGCKWLIRTL